MSVENRIYFDIYICVYGKLTYMCVCVCVYGKLTCFCIWEADMCVCVYGKLICVGVCVYMGS